jgi:uncharacterized membrane protein
MAIRLIFVITTVAWAALLGLAPWLVRSAEGTGLRMGAASVLYVAGSFICHQRPERSFHAAGLPLPVCGRCFGAYAGAALGALLLLGLPTTLGGSTMSARIRWWRGVLLLAVMPALTTLALEWLSLPISNLVRAISGAVVGAAVAAFVSAWLRGELR